MMLFIMLYKVVLTIDSLDEILKTFALIVCAHPYCARNSCRKVMPRHHGIERAR